MELYQLNFDIKTLDNRYVKSVDGTIFDIFLYILNDRTNVSVPREDNRRDIALQKNKENEKMCMIQMMHFDCYFIPFQK